MAKWGEIKCPNCAEQDALWEGMERALEESDAREARLEINLTLAEEELRLTEAKLAKAVEALTKSAEYHESQRTWWDDERSKDIRTTLAELKGQDQ